MIPLEALESIGNCTSLLSIQIGVMWDFDSRPDGCQAAWTLSHWRDFAVDPDRSGGGDVVE